MNNDLIIRWEGIKPYQKVLDAMQIFTIHRLTKPCDDEIWLMEHTPVFTQGQNGKAEHILDNKNIKIIQTDRGGQVTYHGPGQLMIYTLIDLNKKKFTIRDIICRLEKSIINFLASINIKSTSKKEAPGVYVQEKKIASLGLRVKRGCVYHGIAFNIAMDLTPFFYINPCGFKGLLMTQLSELSNNVETPYSVGKKLASYLIKELNYSSFSFVTNS